MLQESRFSLLCQQKESQDHLNDEVDTVYRTFRRLGYPIDFLDKAHRDVRTAFYGEPRELLPTERIPTLAVPYTQFSRQFLRPALHHNKSRVVHSYGNTLKRKLVSTRPPKDFNHTSGGGIYKVPCRDCSKVYIGVTGSNFQVRLEEHRTAVATGKENNAVFQLL